MDDPVGARVARPDDAADLRRLAALLRQSLREQRGGDAVTGALRPDPAAAPHGRVSLVGTIGDAVVGFAAVTTEGDAACVEELFVEPPARGVGVGHALLRAAVRHAQEQGAIRLDAAALPGDRSTKNFFEAHGMVTRLLVVSRTLGDAGTP